MISDIIVKSRPEMIDLTYEQYLDDCAIISISDYQGVSPNFCERSEIEAVLPIFFDDEEGGPTSMSPDDAQRILDFVKDVDVTDISTLYVHCNGGVSRSAGTAAALMQLWFGDDSAIFNNGKYAPNMHCYRTVLDEAGFGYSADEIKEKEAHNYNLWRILNDLD